MVANNANIENYFSKCNAEYFGNELPLPRFKVSHSRKFCAYFSFINEGDWYGKPFSDPCIEVSDYYDYDKKTFVNLMCHEMIHYYLLYKGEDTKCHHGRAFKAMANRMNTAYGLHITETVDVSNIKRNPDAASAFMRFLRSLFD